MSQSGGGHGKDGTYGKEEVADVVRDVDGDTDVGEVVAVAEIDQADGDDVVGDQLLEVLSRLFLAEQHDDDLLDPKGGLEQVVELEDGSVSGVRVCLVHASRLEEPEPGRLLHRVQPERANEGDVARRVHLLSETRLLAPRLDPAEHGQRPQHLVHDKLAGEGQDDGVEDDEGKVPRSLAVPGLAILAVELV